MESYQLYIDGKWRDAEGGATMPAINPYNQDVHAHVPLASPGDVDEAVRAARRAFDDVWSKITPGERANLLGHGSLLNPLDANGKPLY